MSSGALMPRARTAAGDATADVGVVVARIGGIDPVDVLLDRTRRVSGRSIDPLQIAAWLEADGMTDRAARVEYGFADVFDLAQEIHRRAGAATGPPPEPSASVAAGRDLGHGVLYLLPAAIFPAVLAALGAGAPIRGILVVAWASWVCSGVAAWLGYHLLGADRPGSAARVLRWSTAASPVLGLLLGVLLLGGGSAVGIAIAQASYQMSVTTLLFYRREWWILSAAAPAVLAGAAFLVAGNALRALAAAFAGLAVAVTFGAALHVAARRGPAMEPPLWPTVRSRARQLTAVAAFTALTAAYFLLPQARLLPSDAAVALGALPVIAGMGIVEWQAHRFGDRAHALLFQIARPEQFAMRTRQLMLRGLGACLCGVGVLATALLGLLAAAGRLSGPVLAMSVASVLLGAVTFLAFLLARLGRYAWLCGSLLSCVVAFATLTRAAGGSTAATAVVFAVTTALLLVLLLADAAGAVGEARGHRR